MVANWLKILVSPAMVAYWSLKYAIGLSTPFDKVMPERPSFFKVFFLGLTKRLGATGFPGVSYITPPNAYELMMKEQEEYPNYALGEEGLGFWLARPTDFNVDVDPCMVYAFGGGYSSRMGPSQLKFIKYLYESLLKIDPIQFSKLAVLVVDYETTSEDKFYPTQFNHAIRTWENLMQKGFKHLYLLGDSSGGHMAINILQWLSKRSEDDLCVWPEKTLLISPWLNVCAEDAEAGISMENVQYDYMSPWPLYADGKKYAQHVLHPLENPHVNIQLNQEKIRWSKVKTKIAITAGSQEILLKPIVQFSNYIGADLLIEEGGLHDGATTYEPELCNGREDWLTMWGAKTCLDFFSPPQ